MTASRPTSSGVPSSRGLKATTTARCSPWGAAWAARRLVHLYRPSRFPTANYFVGDTGDFGGPTRTTSGRNALTSILAIISRDARGAGRRIPSRRLKYRVLRIPRRESADDGTEKPWSQPQGRAGQTSGCSGLTCTARCLLSRESPFSSSSRGVLMFQDGAKELFGNLRPWLTTNLDWVFMNKRQRGPAVLPVPHSIPPGRGAHRRPRARSPSTPTSRGSR